ncbi:aminodeoxychorismate/anthranilate synthase component II [Haloquadratum walsbyi]|jgi:anthranilate synthase, component II (EC 4.1.3.27)|uniref:anthranilate synthase n=1 Tax=Haloquadratum walsbyi J07HQW2 TaxID=1238425 RepID=U1NF61_9EURY|nr:aminodeoxychorismate/anthranilate synthase component II [Haloquadratum walsbyi]ERG95408.1 MAG: glutamine amidotransferase of anthranilate synthase or aminodeoxychorismate synthase [Haloquadratum walsbyi J07HQW2]
MTLSVLVIDNFDSFTYNLVEYLSEQRINNEPLNVDVLKNTASLEDIETINPDAIVISPGPGHPKNARDVGVTNEVLTTISQTVPTLGVCLGLEAAVYVYGGSVGRAPAPVHGKSSTIAHDGAGIFEGFDQTFEAGRYHSLIATNVPECFEISAATRIDDSANPTGDSPHDIITRRDSDTDSDTDDLIMGIRHREYPIEAVQFHPESVLTGIGHDLIKNFLRRCTYIGTDDSDNDSNTQSKPASTTSN